MSHFRTAVGLLRQDFPAFLALVAVPVYAAFLIVAFIAWAVSR